MNDTEPNQTPIASAVFRGLAERERTKAALDALVKAEDEQELAEMIERLEKVRVEG